MIKEVPHFNEYLDLEDDPKIFKLFLAGTCSDFTEDWQRIIIEKIKEKSDNNKFLSNRTIVIYNPRNISQDYKYGYEELIDWDNKKMLNSDLIITYFDPNTTNKISMFEFGFNLGRYFYDEYGKSTNIKAFAPISDNEEFNDSLEKLYWYTYEKELNYNSEVLKTNNFIFRDVTFDDIVDNILVDWEQFEHRWDIWTHKTTKGE